MLGRTSADIGVWHDVEVHSNFVVLHEASSQFPACPLVRKGILAVSLGIGKARGVVVPTASYISTLAAILWMDANHFAFSLPEFMDFRHF